MTKEQVIQGYLMNSPKVVAEMLYNTIEKYENRSCESCSADYIKCKIFIAYWKKTESSCIDDSKCFYCNKWDPK